MRGTLTQARSFDRPVQLLFVNQLTINIGFYMLMPYLAAHLADDLGYAAWLVGLVLGVRNLTQQGMFALGGSLADRFGYKPLIVAGCALRTLGFALLGLVDSMPALLVASAATGFAGALFNPAVRAYLAVEAGQRRVEAFALFNVFYQAGILAGPLIGLLLTGISFRLTCLVAAAIFAGLTVLQIRAMPARTAAHDPGQRPPMLRDWRHVLSNRAFLLFGLAMIGSYVLSFQVYLALPLEVGRVSGPDAVGTIGVGLLFAVSGLIAILGQVPITAWCKRRWTPGQSISRGLTLMGLAFLPLLVTPATPPAGVPDTAPGRLAAYAVALAPALASAAMLTVGTLIVYPFEMDTVVALANGRLIATHYGLYNTLAGVGITVGNLLTGAALDTAQAAAMPALPWLTLCALGIAAALAVGILDPVPTGRHRKPAPLGGRC